MPSSPTESELRDELLLDIDGYKDTVYFLLALVHELERGPGGKEYGDLVHLHGTSLPVGEQKNTPDLVLLIRKQFGFVGDIKRRFPAPINRPKLIEQLVRYDAVGKKLATDRKVKVGTLLVVPHADKVTAEDHLDQEFKHELPFAVIGAYRDSARAAQIILERGRGELVCPDKSERLRKVVKVSLQEIQLSGRGQICFYDADPPMLYLLEVLWDNVLPALIPEEEYAKPDRPPIVVTSGQLAEILLKSYTWKQIHASLPGPKLRPAVERALAWLEKAKLAKSKGNDRKEYEIHYKQLRHRGRALTLEALVRIQVRLELKPASKNSRAAEKQLSLFAE